MNISNLEQYVAQRNAYARIFGNKEVTLMKAEHRQRIADMLDSDLSPENLTCDGEVRGSALQQKARFLNRCVAELRSIDPNVTFCEAY